MKRKTFQLTSEDARGEKNNHARLTPEIVQAIRKRAPHGTRAEIGAEFGIAASTVSCIINRTRWGHVR